MSERIHALAQLLLGKPSVEECSLDEIKQLTEAHPYFAPAQFLLLQKLKTESSPDVEAQRQKAILYYHDPLQFDYFVSPEKFYVDDSFLLEKKIDQDENSRIIVSDDEEVNSSFIEETPVDETISSDAIETELEDADVLHTDATPGNLSDLETINTEDNSNEQLGEFDNVATEGSIANNEISTESNENTFEETESSVENESSIDTDSFTQPENSLLQTSETIPTLADQNFSKSQNKTVSDSVNEDVIAFEPYHTVDYFASQGIKVPTEDLPKDKLGKQLRSFTEWLKIMKRLPTTELAKSPETTDEKTVEKLATHSVSDNDVVTETMAEVWAKQGARDKAIETYNKLCLLNPSKRSYFAAKIENLKQP